MCILNTAPTSKSSASPWAANKRIKGMHKSLETGRRLPPVGRGGAEEQEELDAGANAAGNYK